MNNDEIEVGATDADLRYWRAKEAVRQGEARLSAQLTVRNAMEARATAITGWSSAILLVTAAAGISAHSLPARAGAAALAIPLLLAAAACIHAARPRDWSMVGYNPATILEDTLGSELEILESIAEGLSTGVLGNNLRLKHMAKSLRLAGWLLISAPLTGAAAFGATSIFI